MSYRRRADKPDANTAEIVEALRAAGCVVEYVNRPVDLLVGHRGRWVLVECKNPEGRNRTTQGQEDFLALCLARGLPIALVRSPEEALGRVVELASGESAGALGED